MNEQIRELWTKAAESTKDHSWESQEKFIERFTELIVCECVQVCLNEGNTYAVKSAGEYQAELFSNAIKKHFGFE